MSVNDVNSKNLLDFETKLNNENVCLSLKDFYDDTKLTNTLLNKNEVFKINKVVISELGHKCKVKGHHILIEINVSRFNKRDSIIKINTYQKGMIGLLNYVSALFDSINY